VVLVYRGLTGDEDVWDATPFQDDENWEEAFRQNAARIQKKNGP
jgi:hypothetical protein